MSEDLRPRVGGGMRQLTSQDAMFVYMERSGTPQHLSTLFVYDQSNVPGGVVRFKAILDYIADRLDVSPIFRQRLAQVPMQLGLPYWVDDPYFDLEYHVRHVALPEPRDWRQLAIAFGRIHSRALDLTRPPWEMHVIEGLDHVAGTPPGSFALVIKYHHSAIDGMSGTEILNGLNDRTPSASPRAAPAEWHPAPEPSDLELIGRAALANMMLPFRAGQQAGSVLSFMTTAARGLAQPGVAAQTLDMASAAPRTRFNARVGRHRVFDGAAFDLADFKQIKAHANATVNDVLIALSSGMLRRYLLGKGELPDEPLVAAVPVSIRAAGDRTPGNAVSVMLAPLATNLADPLERLAAIHRDTQASKALTSAVGANELVALAGNVPAATLALAGRLVTSLGLGHRLAMPFNCVVTNVPGPQVPLYFAGSRLTGYYGAGPVVDGMGLLISGHSYDGKMFTSFLADRDAVPDPAVLRECLEASMAELLAATVPRRARSRKPPEERPAKPRSRRAPRQAGT